jgi:Tol biopolymer transport system component
MPLSAGTRLGGYEILAALGSGGMGEVYRARDTRLDRSVAIKILPHAFTADAERVARFQREAKVLASLNHPHIAAIFGIEEAEHGTALVMELVEGDDLSQRLKQGRIPIDEALAIAKQIALALEAAQGQGIIHRDLKPANIRLRADGMVKVLDFGLAKLAEEPNDFAVSSTMTTAGPMTSVGTILGTTAYMSPEQARGKDVDKRTDIWAFGCVLFEMLTGRAPFNGETISDTLAAILSREADLTTLPASTPSGIRRLLKRCLEKDVQRRLHDIADARIEIDDALTVEPAAAEGRARPQKRTVVPWVIGGLVAGGLLAAYAVLVTMRPVPQAPVYHQLTFRRGSVAGARFAPDGQSVVYSAAWERPPMRLMSTRIDSPDTSVMPLPGASLLSVSSAGKMAILLPGASPRAGGTLAEVSLGGQAPRELVKDVMDADWAPGGDALAITHVVNGSTRLEYPIGTVLYSTAGQIRSPRFSPKGDLIAFVEPGGTAGGSVPEGSRLSVVDLTGHVKVVTDGWAEMPALAWNPGGDEIWFSAREKASRSGGLALHAATLSGAHRLIASLPGIVVLKQIAPDGRVLLSHEQWPVTMMCQAPGETNEREVSWLDYSRARDLSADGRLVLFDENGLASGGNGGVYLRKVDGSPAVRIGDGQALSLSPDGATAVGRPFANLELRLIPTGPGQTQIVRSEGLAYLDASWFPDGTRLLVAAKGPNGPPFLSVQDVAGGAPCRLVDGPGAGAVSPDGRIVASMGTAPGTIVLTPVDSSGGGQSRTLTGVPIGTSIARWEASGRYLFLKASAQFGVDVFRIDVATGHSEVLRTLAPSDVAGMNYPTYSLAMTADGRSYCYSYGRRLGDLFVVSGLK